MNEYYRNRHAFLKLPQGDYHLCADGWSKGRLFNTREQFAFGMSTIALSTLLFPIRVYAFELMVNHFHIILHGNGLACCETFSYIRNRISRRLLKDGNHCLPENYGFKLIPIENDSQMRKAILYVARNPYEKGYAIPGGYPWGSGSIMFSRMWEFIENQFVSDLSTRNIQAIVGSRISMPGDWKISRSMGILPSSFVDLSLFHRLFHDVKSYLTAFVKDYESFAKMAMSTGEILEISRAEAYDIVHEMKAKYFGGRQELSAEERFRLADMLSLIYDLDNKTIADLLSIPEHIVVQVLRSKDFGRPKRG